MLSLVAEKIQLMQEKGSGHDMGEESDSFGAVKPGAEVTGYLEDVTY
jgi:hypothetical protein